MRVLLASKHQRFVYLPLLSVLKCKHAYCDVSQLARKKISKCAVFSFLVKAGCCCMRCVWVGPARLQGAMSQCHL